MFLLRIWQFLPYLTLSLLVPSMLSSVTGAPLLSAFGRVEKVAPLVLDNTGAAASVELSRVNHNGWAAPYARVSHWFDHLQPLQVSSNVGEALKVNRQLSLVRLGENSFKVTNRSNQWQNILFEEDKAFIHVIAPKSTETISLGTNAESLRVFPLSAQQARSIYHYSHDF